MEATSRSRPVASKAYRWALFDPEKLHLFLTKSPKRSGKDRLSSPTSTSARGGGIASDAWSDSCIDGEPGGTGCSGSPSPGGFVAAPEGAPGPPRPQGTPRGVASSLSSSEDPGSSGETSPRARLCPLGLSPRRLRALGAGGGSILVVPATPYSLHAGIEDRMPSAAGSSNSGKTSSWNLKGTHGNT